MFTPIGYFAPQGPDLIPVTGYTAYIDFMSSPITLNSDRIAQIDDLSGNGYHVVQTTPSRQPYWNPAGYWDGQETSNDDYLDWSLANTILANRAPTNDWGVVCGTNETSHRRQPFGLGTGTTPAWRLDFFMNDSAGRRDLLTFNKQVLFSSTNDVNKDIILFSNTDGSTLDWYGRRQTESYATDTANWQSDPNGSTSRFGTSARTSDTLNDGYKGKIYFVAVYPFKLTSQNRIDITNWAVNKWGMTLT